MNVDRHWRKTSGVRIRILAAGLVLLAVGCTVLGWNFRHSVAKSVVGSRAGRASSLLAPGAADSKDDVQARARSLFAGLPLFFEPNLGQGNLDPADARARFVSRGSGYNLFLGTNGAILNLASGRGKQGRITSLEMKLAGANPKAGMAAADRLPGTSHYFLGNDPAKWRAAVPQFARVRYENIYPGINLVFYGNQGHLEYDFQIAAGADPAQAELEFSGARQLQLSDGALVITSEGGSVRLDAPRMYQEIAGRQEPVEGGFVLRDANRAGFAVGPYDHSRELVIDPILNFSTYFGGSGDEHSTSVAVDGSFNIYLTGSTTSANLPVTAANVQAVLNGAQNIYVAKITPPLGSLVAQLDDLTYLGGSGSDTPAGIKVDGAGNPFVAGTTTSGNFPTTPTNAYQSAPQAGSAGTSHVFVTKLKFDFTQLQYSSYLSGNGTDVASGMTIDPAGDLYVTGTTTSNDVASTTDQFPASTLPEGLPYQAIARAPIQFFVTKVDTNAPGTGSILYSTYFGGGNFTTATPVAVGGGIAVDTNLNVYFTGTTNFLYTGCSGCATTDFPILNAYQPCLDQAPPTTVVNPPSCTNAGSDTAADAFVAKLNPSAAQGQQLQWSTYLGGSGDDSSTGVALDSGAANVYVIGTTNSSDVATSVLSLTNTAAYQRCLDTPVNPAAGTACTVPATTPFPDDAFVARLSNPTNVVGTSTNVALNYFSYLGGTGNEAGLGIAVDSNSGAMVTGWSQSADFPVFPAANPIQSQLNGTQDAFVARLNTAAVTGQTAATSWASFFGGSGIDSGTGIALDVNQNTYLAGETNSTDLQVAKPLTAGTNNAGGYDAFVTQLGTAVSLSIQGVLTLGTDQTFVSAGNKATFTYTVTNNGPDPASNIVITDNFSSSITGVPLTFVSASIGSGSCGGATTNSSVSCGPISLQSGSTVTVTVVVTPTPNANGSSPQFFNGGTVQAIGPDNIVLAQTSVPAEMSDYSMSVNPANQSIVKAGDSAVYQVQLTPHPLYNSSISLSCTNLPPAGSCIFAPSSVSLTSASGSTATMSVLTTARPATTAENEFTRRFYAIWFVIPGLAIFGIGGNPRRRRILGISVLCMLFGLLVFLPACSSTKTKAPVSGTPAGNYTVTVTATSGSDSKSQTIGITVP